MKVIDISINTIDESEELMRPIDGAVLSDLTLSVKQYGLLQPILIRKKKNRYEVVFGNHRLYACKRAGLEVIPCIVTDAGYDETRLLRAIENIHRKNLNPVSEGKFLKELAKKHTLKWLSELLNKSKRYIQTRIAIYDKLAPELHSKVGTILSLTNAKALIKVKSKQKQVEIAKFIEYAQNHASSANYKSLHLGFQKGQPVLSTNCKCPICGHIHYREEDIDANAKSD